MDLDLKYFLDFRLRLYAIRSKRRYHNDDPCGVLIIVAVGQSRKANNIARSAVGLRSERRGKIEVNESISA